MRFYETQNNIGARARVRLYGKTPYIYISEIILNTRVVVFIDIKICRTVNNPFVELIFHASAAVERGRRVRIKYIALVFTTCEKQHGNSKRTDRG